jgi:acyl-CoA synthetase (NDP forming)
MEGVRSGRNFMRAADEARRNGKRVVVIRAGGHPESARSTLSHTGKHPSAADVYAGVFRQLGVVEVASLAELTYVMTLLTNAGPSMGPRIGIISASGGACSLIADHVVDAGLDLPELTQALQEKMNRHIPEYGSSLNPVDLSADVVSRPDILHGALAALQDETCIDVWLVFGRPIVDRYYQAFVDFTRTSGKAVIVACGVPIAPEIHAALRDGGIPVLEDPELCLRALGRIARANGTRGVRRGAATPSGITAGIDEDRDFGPVLALSTPDSALRVIRALPASVDDVRDALEEIAGGCVSEAVVERLRQFAASEIPGGSIELDRAA